MVRIKYSIIITLLFFLAACRNSPVEISDGRGELSVTASIDRSLYSGTSLPNGRFIDLSSNSVTLTCTIGETDYTATVTLEADPENPDKYIGTATLSDLPVNVTAAVSVQTHNADSVLICEGSDSVELTEGENSISIKLKISPDSPFLMNINPSEYSFTTIPVGESRFFTVGPLTAGTSYVFFGDTVDDVEGDVVLNLVSQTGELVAISENADEKGFSFTATEDGGYVIACYYNSGTVNINGVAWWSAAGSYTQLAETNRIDTSTSSLTTYFTEADASSYRSIAADNGRFHMSTQSTGSVGYYAYTDNGTTWTVTDSDSCFGASVSGMALETGIADIDVSGDYVFRGQLEIYEGAGQYTGYDIGLSNSSNHYYVPNTNPPEIYYESVSTTNYRISYSGTHAVLAGVDDSKNLHIGMPAITPGAAPGAISPVTIPFSGEIGTADNLQITSQDSTCYLLADSGAIYSYQAGEIALSSPLFTISADTNTYRHLSLYKSNYLVASSPQESGIYIPEQNMVISLFDAANPDEDIQLLIDQGYTFNFHLFSSENYLILLQEMGVPASGTAYTVLVSGNGGFSWISSDVIPLGDPTYSIEKVDIAIDESLSQPEVYLGLTVNKSVAVVYELKTFRLQ